MQAVFLDKRSLDKDDLNFEHLLSSCQHSCSDTGSEAQWTFYDTTAADEVMERTKDAEVIVSNKVVLNKEAIANAQKLKLICVAATGTNNVDTEYAKLKGIRVCNVRAYGTSSVVQHVFTLLLMLVRNIPRYQAAVKNGDWQKSKEFCLLDYPIENLDGKTIGIIGYGELGKAVAKMAEAFSMKVLIARRDDKDDPEQLNQDGYERVSLKTLLAEVDVLSLHCPLTEATRNLVGREELALMKPSSILINMARGGIVDEEALTKALLNGKLGGAAIDVLVEEPPSQDSVLLQLDLPNLIITPHIAWASRTARQNLLNQVAENIEHYYSGQPQNIVE